MSSIALYRDFHPHRAPQPGERSAPACEHQGILGRISAAIEHWHQSRAEQEAGRFIAERGGRLTDDIERQLGEHFIGRGIRPYARPRSFRPFARWG